MTRRSAIAAAATLFAVLLLSVAPASAWPMRAGLELQGGVVLAGTEIGIGSSALTGGADQEWTGRITLTLAPPLPGGVQWRTGLAYQRWTIRDQVAFTFVPTSGPLSGQTVTFALTQTVQELVLPLHARFAPADGLGWFLELGADVNLRLSVRQRNESDDPVTASLSPPARGRTTGPLGAQAEIFEDVGTFGSSNDVTNRFVPVALAATAGLGHRWGSARPVQVSLTLQQGLHDQEDASVAVVRPTRAVLGVGIDW